VSAWPDGLSKECIFAASFVPFEPTGL